MATISSIDSRQQPRQKKPSSTASRSRQPREKPTQDNAPRDGVDDNAEVTLDEINTIVAALNALLDPKKLTFDTVVESGSATTFLVLQEVASGDSLLQLGINDAIEIADSCTNQDELLAAVSGKLLSRYV